MLLGCNCSRELMDLIRENKVDVDYIKLGLFDMYADIVEESASIRPILLHGFGYDEYAGMHAFFYYQVSSEWHLYHIHTACTKTTQSKDRSFDTCLCNKS